MKNYIKLSEKFLSDNLKILKVQLKSTQLAIKRTEEALEVFEEECYQEQLEEQLKKEAE